jgi:3-hydroxyacyl-CoA dehydrogenase
MAVCHFLQCLTLYPGANGSGGGDGDHSRTQGARPSLWAHACLPPLLVHPDSPGCLGRRVWRAMQKAGLHLVDDGVASAAEGDRGWRIAFGTPAGPCGLREMSRLEVVRAIARVSDRESGEGADAPPPLLLDKSARGTLGLKTGHGFSSDLHPACQTPGWRQGHEDEWAVKQEHCRRE